MTLALTGVATLVMVPPGGCSTLSSLILSPVDMAGAWPLLDCECSEMPGGSLMPPGLMAALVAGVGVRGGVGWECCTTGDWRPGCGSSSSRIWGSRRACSTKALSSFLTSA